MDENYRSHPSANLLEERDHQRRRIAEKLRELDEEIEVSEGFRIFAGLSLLEKTYFVFDANHLNLKHVLQEFEQPVVFLRMWEDRRRGKFDLFINDIIRLFHNYIAAAVTLLDHIRILRDSTSLEPGDQADEQRVDNLPLPRFMDDLLMYMLHEGIPFALAELNFGKIGGMLEINSAIDLDIARLRDWRQWSHRAREHLDEMDDKARLGEIVAEHFALVSDLYERFVVLQTDTHQEALGKLDQLKARRRDLEREMERLEDILESAEKTAISVREDRVTLAKQLEAEKQYRTWEKTRADKLEADLDLERNKGFLSRLFGR